MTEAEQYGWSYVFHYFLTMEEKLQATEIPGLNWWYAVQGANWKHPEGKSSNLKDRLAPLLLMFQEMMHWLIVSGAVRDYQLRLNGKLLLKVEQLMNAILGEKNF